MKRVLSSLSVALVFLALALTMFQPYAARTARAADIHEKCEDCSVRNFRQFEHCTAVHGIDHIPCYDQYNEGVVICFRNFCEQ